MRLTTAHHARGSVDVLHLDSGTVPGTDLLNSVMECSPNMRDFLSRMAPAVASIPTHQTPLLSRSFSCD
jgi:hypothetical protein